MLSWVKSKGKIGNKYRKIREPKIPKEQIYVCPICLTAVKEVCGQVLRCRPWERAGWIVKRTVLSYSGMMSSTSTVLTGSRILKLTNPLVTSTHMGWIPRCGGYESKGGTWDGFGLQSLEVGSHGNTVVFWNQG